MMDLKSFLELTGTRQMDVAAATGLSPATISRIVNGSRVDLRMSTIKALRKWADRQAKRLRLRQDQRLKFDL